MAKICFYCGRELAPGERCNCRNSGGASAGGSYSGSGASGGASASGGAAASGKASSDAKKAANQTRAQEKARREYERQTKQRARENARTSRQSYSRGQSHFDWRAFLFRLMSPAPYAPTDSLPKKIGYSLLQTLLRPVSAIETFVSRRDIGVSLFYLILFSLAAGLLSFRFYGIGLLTFLEGSVLGAVIALVLNGLFLLVFRLLSKVRLTLIQMLSSFSASALVMAVFFAFAGAGGTSGTSLISFLLTVLTGIIAGTLLHFLALKAVTRLSSDQLVVNVILVYILFYSLLGILFQLLVPASIGTL